MKRTIDGKDFMSSKKELPVLYIITKLELGGAQKICLSLFERLNEKGNAAFLISGEDGILCNQIAHHPHVRLLKTFRREIFAPWHEIKNFITLIKEIKKIKKAHPDLIVHTHSTKAGILGRWAAWFAGVRKIVHTVHGYGFHPHQNKLAWLAIFTCEFFTSLITSHFVCVSSHDVKIGIKLFPRFKKKHSIIRAAVDWEKFAQPAQKTVPFPEPLQPFVFGTVSCFKPQKNLIDLLQAFELVVKQNPQVQLELIGDGTMRLALETWALEHRLQDKIVFHGWQHEVVPFLQKWHAFVLSSLWEGLPCAIVEARLLHLPILSYKTGGIHDVITSGENGFLFDQGNWQALGQGMLQLSQNQSIHQAMQQYPDNLSAFKNDYMIEQHQQLYKNL